MDSIPRIEAESTISKVVVFEDRAQVTRRMEVEVSSGESKVLFVDLPVSLHRDALQVFVGEGVKCEMRGVVFKPSDPSRLIGADEEAELEEQIREGNEAMQALEKQIQILQTNLALGTAITQLAIEEGPKWDVSKCKELLDFQRRHRVKEQKEMHVLTQELRVRRRHQADLLTRQEVEGAKASKPTAMVEVLVSCPEGGVLRLSLAYIVDGAGWRPQYDFRVDGDTKMVTIGYFGVVQQTTGEDWGDVGVHLSTAKPNLGGKQPELTPWRVSLHPPFLPDVYQLDELELELRDGCLGESESFSKSNKLVQSHKLMSFFDAKKAEKPAPPPVVATSSVSPTSSPTSVIFQIAGKHSIPTTGDDTRVSIAVETFPAQYRYSSVPKLNRHVFLKAKIVNTSEYPLLAGGGNVYLDHNLVASTEIEVVAPGQEFWLSLGVDEAITTKRTFLKREDVDEGGMMSAKRRKSIFSYQFRIKNNKTTREEMVLCDQLPIPDSKEVIITLISPPDVAPAEGSRGQRQRRRSGCSAAMVRVVSGDGPPAEARLSNLATATERAEPSSCTRDENEFIEWIFDLKPGQEAVQLFSYSVEAPQRHPVYGLDEAR